MVIIEMLYIEAPAFSYRSIGGAEISSKEAAQCGGLLIPEYLLTTAVLITNRYYRDTKTRIKNITIPHILQCRHVYINQSVFCVYLFLINFSGYIMPLLSLDLKIICPQINLISSAGEVESADKQSVDKYPLSEEWRHQLPINKRIITSFFHKGNRIKPKIRYLIFNEGLKSVIAWCPNSSLPYHVQ